MLSNLDSTDIRILELLQDNARLTHRELGETLHKSPTPIYRRIKRLEEEGYIKKYAAILNHRMIDRGQMVFTHVQLKDHSSQSLMHFEQEIIKFPEVLECFHMSGNYDFIIRVAVKDLDTYHEFLMKKLFAIMAVGSVQSTFVMKEAKAETAYPLGSGSKKKSSEL